MSLCVFCHERCSPRPSDQHLRPCNERSWQTSLPMKEWQALPLCESLAWKHMANNFDLQVMGCITTGNRTATNGIEISHNIIIIFHDFDIYIHILVFMNVSQMFPVCCSKMFQEFLVIFHLEIGFGLRALQPQFRALGTSNFWSWNRRPLTSAFGVYKSNNHSCIFCYIYYIQYMCVYCMLFI